MSQVHFRTYTVVSIGLTVQLSDDDFHILCMGFLNPATFLPFRQLVHASLKNAARLETGSLPDVSHFNILSCRLVGPLTSA